MDAHQDSGLSKASTCASGESSPTVRLSPLCLPMDDLPKWVENLKIDVELCQEVTQGLEDLDFTTAAAQDA